MHALLMAAALALDPFQAAAANDNRRLAKARAPAANSASASVLPMGACSLSAVGSASQDLITETVYDADSRKTQEIRGLNTSAQITYATYGYTPDGKVATVADADDNLTAYSYDGFDRVIYTIFPSKTLSAGYADASDYEFYVYDANDNRTAVTRRDGLTNRFFFDKLNRQYEALIPSPAEGGQPAYTVNTCYDLLGRKLASAYVTTGPGVETCPLTSSTGMVAWTYDDVGRKTSETTTTASGAFTVGISYDADGNRSTLTWPDGQQLSYSFDTADHFTGVGDAYAGANPAYDSLGRVIGIGRANNASTSNITYDNADRLTGFTHGFPSGAATWSFGLSPASQILSASVNTSAYDWTGGVTGTVTNTPNGLNQDAAIAAVNSGQGYDKLGDLINDGTRQFTYDGENRLVSESGPASMSLVYDASGRLQQTTINGTTTQFVYEGASLVAEYSGSQVLRRYANGPGADQPLIWFEGSSVAAANARYFYADRQGSILQVADNNGNLISGLQYQYDPYGNPSSWTGSRFLYTGQMALPGTSLYYYKARVYDPVNQRFLQTDPIGYKDQLNLYEYVGDDPVDHTDPAGAQSMGATDPDLEQEMRDEGMSAPGLQSWKSYDKQKDLAASIEFNIATFALGDELLESARGAQVVSHVFWSGGSKAMLAAESWARANGGITLEMTATGKMLTALTKVVGFKNTRFLWVIASKNFAKTAGGEAHVFLGDVVNPRGIWNTIERDILESKGTRIVSHTAEDAAKAQNSRTAMPSIDSPQDMCEFKQDCDATGRAGRQ